MIKGYTGGFVSYEHFVEGKTRFSVRISNSRGKDVGLGFINQDEADAWMLKTYGAEVISVVDEDDE